MSHLFSGDVGEVVAQNGLGEVEALQCAIGAQDLHTTRVPLEEVHDGALYILGEAAKGGFVKLRQSTAGISER
jgi:hypothetical protein